MEFDIFYVYIIPVVYLLVAMLAKFVIVPHYSEVILLFPMLVLLLLFVEVDYVTLIFLLPLKYTFIFDFCFLVHRLVTSLTVK